MENQYLDQARDWWSTLHFSAIQKRGLALLAILVIAISALFVMRGSTQEVVAAPAPLEIDSVTTATLMVDVAGGVVHPGVYSLPLNARVFEAIKAAGGLAPGADASEVNQARVLRDGEHPLLLLALRYRRAAALALPVHDLFVRETDLVLRAPVDRARAPVCEAFLV